MMNALYKLDDFLMVQRARLKNYLHYKRGARRKFIYELHHLFLSRRQEFGVHQFYQNYPPLGIRGERDSLNRQAVYGLGEILRPDMEVLDIGSNVGFFSILLADRVKHIHLLEYEPQLVEIARRVAEKEGKHNVTCICEDFKQFDSERKFDFIFSFAVHWWVGMPRGDYVNKVRSHLKDGGLMLFESHKLDSFGEVSDIEKTLREDGSLRIIRKGTTDDDFGGPRDFFLVAVA